ncbi:MAG: LysM peptidoglycan-binding domain-containing protein [Clostridiales bacterium]|nr:LysM peptidoglycan-binding domain-containing protein [Clostridiales bacterium]
MRSRKQESEGQAVTNQENSSMTLPKNIRQIGTFGDKYRIYIEDFVYTYVHRFLHQRKRADVVLAAVLLGKSSVCGEQEYIFISGAQKVDFDIPEQENREHGSEEQESRERGSEEQERDRPNQQNQNYGSADAVFARQEEFWDRVYQRIKNSFDHLDILGWYFNLDGSNLEVNTQLQQFFESTYKKGSRFLYYEDSLEQIDAFFVQEQHRLQRLTGYAVYYEKNPQMQQFMMEEKERMTPRPLRESYLAEQHGDEVVQNYRAIMNKLNEKPKKTRLQPVVFAAGAAVLVIVAATAVTQIGNYQNLKVLQQTMQALSGSANQEEALSAEEEDAGTNDDRTEEAGSDDITETSAADGSGTGSDGGSDGGSNEESSISSEDGTPDVSEEGSSGVSAGDNTASSEGDALSEEESTGEDSVSGAGTSVQAASNDDSTAAQSSTSGYYTVQSGDSLLSISQSVYNTTEKVEEICALNGIEDMNMIYAGQTLLLP